MEKRKMREIEINDEKGMLKYTIIPNYKLKEEFITETEFKFYKALKKVAYELQLNLFTQVALNRIIQVNNRRNQRQLRNRIDKKSIDFVLYDEKIKRVVCCIELDDPSHENPNRKERDEFLNDMLKGIVKLIHIQTENYYDCEKLKQKITNSITLEDECNIF